MTKVKYMVGAMVLALLLAAGTMGCPKSRQAQAILLFSGGGSGKALAAALLKANTTWTVDDIERFSVTIRRIELQKSARNDEEEDTEGEDITDGKVIFDSDLRVDLIQLQDLSALVTSKPLDPGVYTKIKISIEDPEMVLKSALDQVIPASEIQLTANNRLFVEQDFEVPPRKPCLILFDMNGFEVEDNDQRAVQYKLLPHALDVGVRVEDAHVLFTGQISSIDEENSTIYVEGLDSDPVQVILPDDATPSISELSTGQTVEVDGMLDADGIVTATSITVIP